MSYQDITLTSGATTLTLPGDMVWTDRRRRSVMAQNVEIAANGTLIIEEFQQVGGYPITLVAAGAGDTWVLQDAIDALIALADQPLATPMTLTYNDGTVVSVRFRHEGSTPAVQANVLYSIFPQDGTTPYSLTLRLMQASA
jgi:hypothetical protein